MGFCGRGETFFSKLAREVPGTFFNDCYKLKSVPLIFYSKTIKMIFDGFIENILLNPIKITLLKR